VQVSNKLRSEGKIYIIMRNFIKIRHTVAKYCNFSIDKMAAHVILDFQNFKFSVANRVRKANAHHHTKFIKISRTVLEIAIFHYQGGCRLPSWIFKFSNSWLLIGLGGLICIVIPNYIKIIQMAAEILHLSFLK